MHQIQSLVSDFTSYLRQVGYRAGSVYMLPYCVQEFLTFTGTKPLHGIRATDIVDFYAWLQVRPLQKREGTLSGAMIDHYGYALRVFFSWLLATGHLDIDPASGLRWPRLGAGQRQPLSPEQIGLLFDHAKDVTERVVLHLFYSCGLRRSEAEALDLPDVSLTQRLLYVRSGKGARRRVVPLAAGVTACLQHYYRAERAPLQSVYDESSFMLGRMGQRLRGDSMNDVVQVIGQRAKLEEPVTPHRLRHSIATHLLGRGMALEQVRVFLGHGSLDTTQIYARGAAHQILAL